MRSRFLSALLVLSFITRIMAIPRPVYAAVVPANDSPAVPKADPAATTPERHDSAAVVR